MIFNESLTSINAQREALTSLWHSLRYYERTTSPYCLCSITKLKNYYCKSLKKMKFPLFRRFIGGSSYFKVLNEENWVELKKRPDASFDVHEFIVSTFVDRNYLSDLINVDDRYYEEISKEEYEAVEASLADQPE